VSFCAPAAQNSRHFDEGNGDNVTITIKFSRDIFKVRNISLDMTLKTAKEHFITYT